MAVITFLFIARFKFKKDFRNHKLVLYLSACFNIIFISILTVISLYSGKLLRYFGWSSVILILFLAILLLPSLYKLKKEKLSWLFNR